MSRFSFQRETDRVRTALTIPPVSLMSPTTNQSPPTGISATAEQDLGLSELIQAFTLNKHYLPFIRQIFIAIQTDAEVIRWRQQVLDDFLNNPSLVESLQDLLPRLANLREGHDLLGQRRRNVLLETIDKLTELDTYVSIVKILSGLLEKALLTSPALTTLRDDLLKLAKDENFLALSETLPELREPMQNIRSITIGVNLDAQLQPSSAVLLAINNTRFNEPSSFLERLIGLRADNVDESGIAPLHRTVQDGEMRILTPLFYDLDRILNQVAQPVVRALSRYSKVSSRTLTGLEHEIAFFTAAARWIQKQRQRGIKFCKPEISVDRITEIKELINPALLIGADNVPVGNDVELNAQGCIAILTGPNSGGKTTHLRSVGLAHVLFQIGLLIPAQQARIGPVDTIHTHFPALENRQQGRLAEEASRLREIFQQATSHSLILLNETFSSTSSGEALYLAQDILGGLRAMGARTIFATHLSDLVEKIAEIESTVSGDGHLFSLTAGVRIDDTGQTIPTFQITRGLPLGRSYAQEIAKRHGISLNQILQLLQD